MAAGLLVLAVAAAPLSAQAAQPRVVPAAGGAVEAQPTAEELAAQRATRRARQEVQAATDAVSLARAALRKAALDAGDALESSAVATRALQVAEQEDARQRDLLTGAERDLAAHQALLGRWAREAYADGGTVGANLTVMTLLGAGSGDDVGDTLTWLQRVGRDKSRALQELRSAEAARTGAAARSRTAAAAAGRAAVAAAAARQAATAALARQRSELAAVQNVLALRSDRADAALARQRNLRARTQAGDNRVTGAVGDCPGGDDVQQYPNGQIPPDALCPLAADPRQRLRADAAFGFDRLTRAYRARFGAPPCITDSYRTYAQQVRLFAAKPGLAAVPGSSNHGWGTALDLCGGIQSFTSAEHAWMLDNAPLYGWFHPGWAQAGGSRPEPWHWEFSG